MALIEGTNVSVGRGTDTPFEVVGAPWIKGRELAAYLNGRGIQSVRFVPIAFTPSSSNFAGERCEGVNLIILDRNTLDSPELGIELASALHKLYPNDFKMERMADLLVNQSVFEAIGAGEDPQTDCRGLAGAAGGIRAPAGKVFVVQVELQCGVPRFTMTENLLLIPSPFYRCAGPNCGVLKAGSDR